MAHGALKLCRWGNDVQWRGDIVAEVLFVVASVLQIVGLGHVPFIHSLNVFQIGLNTSHRAQLPRGIWIGPEKTVSRDCHYIFL